MNMSEINCLKVSKMQNTLGIFEDRKEEINFYYSIMIEIESAEGRIETIDNNRLIKIMKSNLLLMLYKPC